MEKVCSVLSDFKRTLAIISMNSIISIIKRQTYFLDPSIFIILNYSWLLPLTVSTSYSIKFSGPVSVIKYLHSYLCPLSLKREKHKHIYMYQIINLPWFSWTRLSRKHKHKIKWVTLTWYSRHMIGIVLISQINIIHYRHVQHTLVKLQKCAFCY